MKIRLTEKEFAPGLILKPIKSVSPQRINFDRVVARFKPLEVAVPISRENPPIATYDDSVTHNTFSTNVRILSSPDIAYSDADLNQIQQYVSNQLDRQIQNAWYTGTETITLNNLNDITYATNGALWANNITSSATTAGYTNSYRVEIVADASKIEAWVKQSKLAQLRNQIRSNLLIKVKHRDRKPLPVTPHQAAELKARETLREMILESEWRRYITNGFIMVKGRSGLWYQIFSPTLGERVRVYKDNKPIESICIHTDSLCPPTDHVINLKVLVEYDEDALRSGGNIRPFSRPSPIEPSRPASLITLAS